MRLRDSSALCVVLLAVLAHQPSFAYATVVRELQINSKPDGADVYLKRASKEVYLGKTPLKYKAEFHSEISVLRMTFKKKGHRELILKVSADEEQVVATLRQISLVDSPSIYSEPTLRALQTEINPILIRTLPEILNEEGLFPFDLAVPATVSSDGHHTYLLLRLKLGDERPSVQRDAGDAMLKAIWDQFGGTLVLPLARELQAHPGIDGIVLSVGFNETHYLFGVGMRVETKIEMQCVAGSEPNGSITIVQLGTAPGAVRPAI